MIYSIFVSALIDIKVNICTVDQRYTPQTIDLEHKMKPFNPDFIPAVGDIDAFLKVRHQVISDLWIQTKWLLFVNLLN